MDKLKDILDKLYFKYEFDNKKPTELSPSVIESIVLKTFINGVDPNLSSIILSRKISTFREAYFTLEENGMIRQSKVNINVTHFDQNKRGHNYTTSNINGASFNRIQNREKNSEQFKQNCNQNFNRNNNQ